MLNRVIKEIRICIKNECFIAALALALTVPDICGNAEYPNDGVTSRYIKWFNTYIGDYEKSLDEYGNDMPYMSGELIYNLRNSILHQGNPNIILSKIKEERCKVNQFILSISDFTNGGIKMVSYGRNNEIVDRMITINIVNLCEKICRVAERYYENNSPKFDFFNYEIQDERNKYETCFSLLPIDSEDSVQL